LDEGGGVSQAKYLPIYALEMLYKNLIKKIVKKGSKFAKKINEFSEIKVTSL